MILKNPHRFEAAETIFESDESKKTNKQFYILIHLDELENLCTFNSLLTLHLDFSLIHKSFSLSFFADKSEVAFTVRTFSTVKSLLEH